jgi:hypothetical protein
VLSQQVSEQENVPQSQELNEDAAEGMEEGCIGDVDVESDKVKDECSELEEQGGDKSDLEEKDEDDIEDTP